MFEVKIESQAVDRALEHVAQGMHDASPLMRSISEEFRTQTEANFAAEGRPKWLGLKPSTIDQRTRRGSWPGRIMQISGQLAASYSTGHDADSATIGSNKVYAAIQNLGGDAGRGHKSHIEPRPQLPIDAQGNLQPDAEEAILGLANDYLARLIP